MDTAVVVIVLLLVIALFGWIGWLLVRQAGWERTKILLISPLLGSGSAAPPAATPTATPRITEDPADARHMPAVTDEALRSLREEIHGELLRATGLTREFDARLTRVEAMFGDSRRTPDDLEAAINDVDARQRRIAEKLRQELGQVQRTTSSFGERRITAVSDLYSHLALVESALASVVNPALLPGEPISLPQELGTDAFVWDNWRDVGDRAYAFGNIFNQHRYVLDDDVAAAVESFITTLRQALTGAVYPNVQASNPTQVQRAQVRSGLTLIVSAIPDIRRKLETSYRADTITGDSLPIDE